MKEFCIRFTQGLGKGLRPFAENPRNNEYLVDSQGAYPWQGALKTLDAVSVMAGLTALNETFPFPQIFQTRNALLVCGRQSIYEYVGGSLVMKIGSLTAGTIWTIADFQDYIVFCNGKQLVKRDGKSFAYSIISDANVPVGYSVCNLNGQLLIAAPSITIPSSETV